jgi:lysophospholipase L1-like esterase
MESTEQKRIPQTRPDAGTHSGLNPGSKPWLRRLLLFIIGVVLIFACAEAWTRLLEWHRTGRNPLSNDQPGALRYDATLGWATRASYARTYAQSTFRRTPYVVNFSQNASGLRVCPGSGKKMLVVGDSDTEAWEVSDGKQYYCVAARDLNATAVAYGAGGFGSLQERMVLDRLIPSEQPDLIVVQIGSNDFINNDYDLEKVSFTNNHSMMRPYWRSGRIEYRWPSHFFPDWVEEARSQSRLLTNWYNRKLAAVVAKSPGVEAEIDKTGASHPGFLRAAAETREIFAQIKTIAGGRSLIALATDLKEPYQSAYRQMFHDLGIVLIEDAGVAANRAYEQGVDVYVRDARHWNETGHRIYGDALAQAIRSHPELHFP